MNDSERSSGVDLISDALPFGRLNAKIGGEPPPFGLWFLTEKVQNG